MRGLDFKSAIEALQAILHGRWGVAQGCNCRSILDAIASLIEAQRPELVLVLIEQELNSQTSLTQHGVSSTYFGHLMRNYGD